MASYFSCLHNTPLLPPKRQEHFGKTKLRIIVNTECSENPNNAVIARQFEKFSNPPGCRLTALRPAVRPTA